MSFYHLIILENFPVHQVEQHPVPPPSPTLQNKQSATTHPALSAVFCLNTRMQSILSLVLITLLSRGDALMTLHVSNNILILLSINSRTISKVLRHLDPSISQEKSVPSPITLAFGKSLSASLLIHTLYPIQ